ncbi:glutathione synthase [Sulfurivirga caldicuralii]|uniref:Glutathione synthetase n=1 Tax=Sulfurivirga caldicuralii TaxID=364032 RepID=A0A1N6DT23_9GAMM|nr:glutathione synthase [Sulfurivirga caldicuralii]SIN73958.1 glutathione synthase [Sulfurivirga caldicuralii]
MKLLVVMDPIASIKPWKDSTFAMMLAAQARDHRVHYTTPADLWLDQATPMAHCAPVEVFDRREEYYQLGTFTHRPLTDFDAVLMRQDPPFDQRYLTVTHLLSLAEKAGVWVINATQAVRDCNEKLFTAWFPQCMPPTRVSARADLLKAFIAAQQDTILKPLHAMGGAGIFRVRHGDPNTSVIIETLTQQGQMPIMAQRFLPEIAQGDKRILMIDGEPVPYALARIPAQGETRGNLAAGGEGVGMPLSERERWLAAQVGPTLKEKGLVFVGLDVIGDYITEINVTSPTCIRELDAQFGLDIAGDLIEHIAQRLTQRNQA